VILRSDWLPALSAITLLYDIAGPEATPPTGPVLALPAGGPHHMSNTTNLNNCLSGDD
jgi:hypothetical protein